MTNRGRAPLPGAPPSRAPGHWWRGAQATASVGLAVVLLGLVLPKVTGAAWADVWDHLEILEPLPFLGLLALWVLGLYAYSFVLAACLPGMNRAQAMVANIVGSGVANLVPFGGAAGVGITWWLARSWGFTTPAIALYTVATGVINLVAKSLLPPLTILLLLVTGARVGGIVLDAAVVGAAVCAALVGVLAVTMASPAAARRTARGFGWVAGWAAAAVRRGRTYRWETQALALRERAIGLLAGRWPTITLGMLAYMALQALLMWFCLLAVGGPTGIPEVLTAFAAGRLLTAVVLTPGGTGFVETGAAAVLVSLGGDPATSVAGVVLFSVFTYVLEIPGGALGWVVHLLMRRWRQAPAGEARPTG